MDKKKKRNRIAVKATICPNCGSTIDLRKRDWIVRTLPCPYCGRVFEVLTIVGWVEHANLDGIGKVS